MCSSDLGSATSTTITVKRTGKTDATTTGTAATFTLVKGDADNTTGDPSANVAAVTNTYQADELRSDAELVVEGLHALSIDVLDALCAD